MKGMDAMNGMMDETNGMMGETNGMMGETNGMVNETNEMDVIGGQDEDELLNGRCESTVAWKRGARDEVYQVYHFYHTM